MQTIKKSIQISAPRKTVWDVLFSDEAFRIWCAEFSEGSHAEGDWSLGSRIIFKDHSGSGLVGNIIRNKHPAEMAVEYECMIVDGEEQPVDEIKGGVEAYFLTEKDGGTHLAIESDMGEAYVEHMSSAWDRALLKLKDLAEKR